MPVRSNREAERRGDGAVGLHYVGAGAALADIPARDLSADEAAAYDRAELLASGLYTDDAPPAAPETSEA